MNVMGQKESFIKARQLQLESIINRMINANQVYYSLLRLNEAKVTHNRLMNESVAFFTTVRRSFVQTLFIETANMFDDDKNSNGIKQLLIKLNEKPKWLDQTKPITFYDLKSIDDNKYIGDEVENISILVTTCLAKIDELSGIIANVQAQRDKFYAHMDKNADITKFFDDFKVSYEDFGTLLLFNTNTVMSIFEYFYGGTISPMILQYKDFENLIQSAERGFEYIEKGF